MTALAKDGAAPEGERSGLWAWLVRAARKVVTERSSPARMGWAVALGVLIGCSPFIGLHLLIVIIVATALGLNRAVTYLAANISVPWMQPILLFASVQLGTFVLHGRFLPMSMDAVRGIEPVDFGMSWLIGSLLLGIAIGAPAGWAAYLGLSAYRRKNPLPADPVAEALEATLARFGKTSRFLFGYVRAKLSGDPLYAQLARLAPLPGPVLDLGCGRGLAALVVAQRDPNVDVVGWDWDEAKVARARQVATGLPRLRFEALDVRNAPLPSVGTVLLLDVLHYAPIAEQDALLERVAAAVGPGGVVVIRDLDDKRGLRAALTRGLEKLGCWLSVNRGATLAFRPMAQVIVQLEAKGFVCSVEASAGDLPTANVFVVARRS